MEQKLRRHVFRALVGALVPPIIAAFYLVIYFRWLRSATSTGGIETGPPGASLVFYAWFIIGVFGLSLGEYGLAGSEGGMMMAPSGRTRHAGHLLLHADKTWTGLGGWSRAIRAYWTWREGPSFAWAVLATATLISYIALPLSGLTLELRAGYAVGTRPAVVHGVNSSTFNVPDAFNALHHARLTWKTGRLERLPGRSVIYTAEASDKPLGDLSTQAVPLIFVGPQSDDIVSGRAWGVAAQYNCSIVSRLDDFILYKYRNDTIDRGSASVLGDRYRQWEGATFEFLNWTAFPGHRVAARFEIATSLDFYSTHISPREYKEQYVTGVYDEASGDVNTIVRDYPGLDEPVVIEAVLWQAMEPDWVNVMPGVSLDLGTTVADLHDTSGGSNYTNPGDSVAAIGVKCACASAIGQATIDGLRRTFSDFARETGPGLDTEADRLTETPLILPLAAYLIPLQADAPEDWVEGLYASVLANNMVRIRKLNEFETDYEEFSGLPRLLTSDDLRRSMLQAFGSYLNQLMYRGFQATTVQPSGGDGLVWAHQSLVSAEETIILGYGPVPPAVVAALLILWASICGSLAVCYSFRRRWAETLDSYSVIRFGADAGRNGAVDGTENPREMENCYWLKSLPGMVGDSLPGYDFGYITLADAVINKEKHYL
ncbi:hypothetical protein MFIFM68171_11108 [Madurella fahalii]|uniref:Uncharacterized protein n=1 Tax=Madurella fahalii TaxID=1157608 RepID=A0ABQ0GT35_9PEZI